ncbi:MAG: NUDIX domain-containing protein [Bacteroidota bacterium]
MEAKEIDKIALISIKDGKILSTRSFGKDKYYIPGGKREDQETDEQTLAREIWEELMVRIVPESVNYVGTFTAQADGYKKRTTVKMTCYNASFSGTPKASSEIEEVKWLQYVDRDRVSKVDQKIFDFLKSNGELQ